MKYTIEKEVPGWMRIKLIGPVPESDLRSIVTLRRLAYELNKRLDRSFGAVMGLNSAFLAAGIAGLITPQTSSLLHNATTIALSLDASRSYDVA